MNCSSHGIEHEKGVEEGENLAKNVGKALTWGQLYPPNNIVGRWVDWEVNRPYPGNAHLTQAVSVMIKECPHAHETNQFFSFLYRFECSTVMASEPLLGLWRIGERLQKWKMSGASLSVSYEYLLVHQQQKRSQVIW